MSDGARIQFWIGRGLPAPARCVHHASTVLPWCWRRAGVSFRRMEPAGRRQRRSGLLCLRVAQTYSQICTIPKASRSFATLSKRGAKPGAGTYRENWHVEIGQMPFWLAFAGDSLSRTNHPSSG